MSTASRLLKIVTAATAIAALSAGMATGAQALPLPERGEGPPATPRTTLVPLVVGKTARDGCSADGLRCVALTEAVDADGRPRPVIRLPDHAAPSDAPADEAFSGEAYAVWPNLIVLGDGGFLAGVETRFSTSYSGGGGSATVVRLFRLSEDGSASGDPVLTLPLEGALMIRACFDELDFKQRAGACHDEYDFAGKMRIDATDGGMPVIIYSTQAWAFPRGASRNEDSTTRGPLGPADLVRQRDETCSFRRRFELDIATGRYVPDQPLPDCSAYTEP